VHEKGDIASHQFLKKLALWEETVPIPQDECDKCLAAVKCGNISEGKWFTCARAAGNITILGIPLKKDPRYFEEVMQNASNHPMARRWNNIRYGGMHEHKHPEGKCSGIVPKYDEPAAMQARAASV